MAERFEYSDERPRTLTSFRETNVPWQEMTRCDALHRTAQRVLGYDSDEAKELRKMISDWDAKYRADLGATVLDSSLEGINEKLDIRRDNHRRYFAHLEEIERVQNER